MQRSVWLSGTVFLLLLLLTWWALRQRETEKPPPYFSLQRRIPDTLTVTHLGDTTTVDRDTPTEVATLVDFTDLALGGGHSCGLDEQGGAWCWGHGAIGAGERDAAIPTAVAGEHSFKSLTASGAYWLS